MFGHHNSGSLHSLVQPVSVRTDARATGACSAGATPHVSWSLSSICRLLSLWSIAWSVLVVDSIVVVKLRLVDEML